MTKIINHGELREHGENNALAKYKGKSFVKEWGCRGKGKTFLPKKVFSLPPPVTNRCNMIYYLLVKKSYRYL